MKPKFTYSDAVKVREGAHADLRPGERASVIAVLEGRENWPSEKRFDTFRDGTVYTIEFDDGVAVEVHEADLEPDPISV